MEIRSARPEGAVGKHYRAHNARKLCSLVGILSRFLKVKNLTLSC